jgi:hypothetical protein
MSVGEAAGSGPLLLDWKQRRRRLRRWMLRFLAGAAVVVALGIGTIRVINLWGIPDAPEPFDIAAFKEAEAVPDQANAHVLFRQAQSMLVAAHTNPFEPLWSGPKTNEWSETSPEVRDWVEKNRPALEVWRRGTNRAQSAALPVGDASKPHLSNIDIMGWLRFALLEASRLEDEGDLAGAWRWHKARLRALLLIGRGSGVSQRQSLLFLLGQIFARTQAWAESEDMTVPLLRQAITDIEAMAALHDRGSDVLKREYIRCLAELEQIPKIFDEDDLRQSGLSGAAVGNRFVPPEPLRKPYRQFELMINVEPERSRRLARLIWANWLAEADKPPALRAKVVSSYPLVFDADPGSKPLIDPASLARLSASAPLLTITRGGPKPPPRPWSGARDYWPDSLTADRRARAALIVGLAIRIYVLENDGKDPATSQALVGKILPKLPDDFIAPEDDVPATNSGP